MKISTVKGILITILYLISTYIYSKKIFNMFHMSHHEVICISKKPNSWTLKKHVFPPKNTASKFCHFFMLGDTNQTELGGSADSVVSTIESSLQTYIIDCDVITS